MNWVPLVTVEPSVAAPSVDDRSSALAPSSIVSARPVSYTHLLPYLFSETFGKDAIDELGDRLEGQIEALDLANRPA